MNFFRNFPYTKTTGISLFLHGIVIIGLGTWGFSAPVADPPAFVAVAVDIVPASVVDMGDMAKTMAEPPPPAPALVEKPAPRPAQSVPRTEPLSPALPGEAGETSVAQAVSLAPPGTAAAVSTGTGTVETTAVGKGDAATDGGGPATNANCLYGPKPTYPQAARKAGWEGAVTVRVLIDTDGSVASVSVREGSGYTILDEAAAQAVKKWRFSPAKKGGVPITSFYDIKVRFRLMDA